ncbi:MAG TPA: DHH family phosphoesterase [Clostridiales bacterium]|jgi:c-di-AMP phosphodiesterase-like protein|nr:DHH family phosphoesterase [Clostridiales bacterium]
MEKRLLRLIRPGFGLYIFVLLAFIGVNLYFHLWYVAAVEGVVVALLAFYTTRSYRRRKREILKNLEYLSGSNAPSAVGEPLHHMPMPVVLLRISGGEVIWSNERFQEISDCPPHYNNVNIKDLFDDFDLQWIIEGRLKRPDFYRTQKGRVYEIFATLLQTNPNKDSNLYVLLYWRDCTEEQALRKRIEESRPVVAELLFDNYEELAKNNTEAGKATIMAKLDDLLNEWCAEADGIMKRTDRDRYLFLYTEKSHAKFAEARFPILEKARQITGANGLPVTLSIGVGRDGSSLQENVKYAHLALDMALSRGGDQAVVKNRQNYDFYGGTTKEIEKRSRVRSRMMAGVLKSMIEESSSVFVMGHRIADLDSLGGAAGVVCAARNLGKKAYIVIDRHYSNAETMIQMLEGHPAYQGVLISEKEAMVEVDANSLLVVVDTNRANFVESPALLETCQRIAVIDHHRRTADYIDNAALSIHEPAASSVGELVTEILQYIVEPGNILKVEASAMLAGIVLDTKSFMIKTGSRTFEAAAFLRRAGADGVDVKRLFQNDLDDYIKRSDLVRRVTFIDGIYAITESDTPIDRALAAGAADDLMNLTGVACAFVLYPFEDTISISARSLGRINVQLIMEKLGGGGHFTTAGAQVKGKTMEEVKNMLKDALIVYNYEQK